MAVSPTTQPAGDPAGLSLKLASAGALARLYGGFDLSGMGPVSVPWGDTPSLSAFQRAVAAGAVSLPRPYQTAYVKPLQDSLPQILAMTSASGGTDPAETLLGAVYDYAQVAISPALRRFDATIADFFLSFAAREVRARAGLQPIERLPPLATFRRDGAMGAYTFPADIVSSMAGADIAVVSLPATYAAHPVLWGALAHETAGHDVVHAQPDLLDNLRAIPLALLPQALPSFGVAPSVAQLLGLLWSYWMDEAAADVCAVLNMGPAFALNFTPLLAAFHADSSGPALWTSTLSGADQPLDVHPTDILRIGLALGATLAQLRLDPVTRDAYADFLTQLGIAMGGGASSVRLQGEVAMPGSACFPVDVTLSLDLMQQVAAMVGAAIAGTALPALNGFSLQAIETWDDADERAAWRLAAAMKGQQPLPPADCAHILAGATLALYDDPSRYDEVTAAVTSGLNRNVAEDPLWGWQMRTTPYRTAIAAE